MEKLHFKTNINCGNCIRAITPYLDKAVGETRWQVDTAHPEKILTVEAEGVAVAAILKAVAKAGFEAVPMTT